MTTPKPSREFAPGLWVRDHEHPKRLADFRLMVFDMDSTLINIECIDELADAAGRRAEVAAITEASMRGEIPDFKESLRRRVAMLAGVSVDFVDEVIRERLRPNPGAAELVSKAQAAGLRTMVVSGGFTLFAQHVQNLLGLDEAHANTLGVKDGHLTGEVLGDIVDGEAKRQHLLRACRALNIPTHQAIAVGDGANDLPMMRAAGLSIAYHAKPVVDQAADLSIRSGPLTSALSFLR